MSEALQDPRKGRMPEKVALTVKEAAALLGTSPKNVYTLIHRADFPAYPVGGRWFISTEGLREWVREQVAQERARTEAGAWMA